MSIDTKIHEKISALLRKAERTDNPHEAEAYSAKAEELLVKWGIDRALLEDKEGRREEIVLHKMTFPGAKGQTRKSYLYLCYLTGLGLGGLEMIETPHQNEYGYDRKLTDLTIVGHESDVESAMWLMSSIMVQGQTAVAAFWRNEMDTRYLSAPPAGVRSKAKESFLSGYAHTVKERLKALRTRVIEDAGTGTDLVLVDRSVRVRSAFEDFFPSVRSRKSRSTVDRNAFGNGAAAGHSADLGQTRFRGSATAELG